MRVDEHTIDLAGSPVFYRSAPGPESAPGPQTPAVYLHGVPTSSDDWMDALERTGGIAPDLIGFGRSAKGGHLDYSINGHANFIESLLDALAIERVKLVVHDWGAGGGLAFAQRHPERIERLVLINALPLLPGFRWHRFARLWRLPMLGELAMGATTRSLLARALRSGAGTEQAWSEHRINAVWQQFDQGTQRAILRLYRSADERRLAEAGQGLGGLQMPALVLWGALDPWLGADFARAYAQTLPNAELELVPDAGHWPWLDDPAVVERVAQFLG